MADRFSKTYATIDSPAYDAFVVSANDSAVFTQPTRAVYVGEAGNLHVQMLTYDSSNTEVTFVAVPAGTTLNIRIEKVFANTTANNIIGLY